MFRALFQSQRLPKLKHSSGYHKLAFFQIIQLKLLCNIITKKVLHTAEHLRRKKHHSVFFPDIIFH